MGILLSANRHTADKELQVLNSSENLFRRKSVRFPNDHGQSKKVFQNPAVECPKMVDQVSSRVNFLNHLRFFF